jgi:hypothetical protein
LSDVQIPDCNSLVSRAHPDDKFLLYYQKFSRHAEADLGEYFSADRIPLLFLGRERDDG